MTYIYGMLLGLHLLASVAFGVKLRFRPVYVAFGVKLRFRPVCVVVQPTQTKPYTRNISLVERRDGRVGRIYGRTCQYPRGSISWGYGGKYFSSSTWRRRQIVSFGVVCSNPRHPSRK